MTVGLIQSNCIDAKMKFRIKLKERQFFDKVFSSTGHDDLSATLIQSRAQSFALELNAAGTYGFQSSSFNESNLKKTRNS